MDAGMKALINRQENMSACIAYARSHGFVPMAEDGHEKVEWGITSREEVLRVLSE
jgi:type II secretory ATPase GspE/PulE/Tfp pilus assembly ATPase PilB-like protein